MTYPIVSVDPCCCSYGYINTCRSQRAKREFNMVLLHPDDGSVESWDAEGSADKMRKDFEGWDPKFVLVALVHHGHQLTGEIQTSEDSQHGTFNSEVETYGS